MAGAPGQLAALRSVFRNPDRTSGLTCAVCTTPAVGQGYRHCFQCNSHLQTRLSLANVVAPITYAVEGSQAMRDLYNYKAQDGGLTAIAARDRLFNGLYTSLSEHLACFEGITTIATVPSSGGRLGSHPLEQMRSMFDDGFDHAHVEYIGPPGLDRQQRRVLAPERYEVDSRSLEGARVLLLDDAWVSGVHTQSVAAALKISGASHVAAVPIGRVVSPSYSESREYLAQHPAGPFDPSICPISGARH